MSNHQIAVALQLDTDRNHNYFGLGSNSYSVLAQMGVDADSEDPLIGAPPGTTGYNHMWWFYTPATDIHLKVQITVNQYANYVGLFKMNSNNSWTTTVAPQQGSYYFPNVIEADLTGGSTYYIMVANFDDQYPYGQSFEMDAFVTASTGGGGGGTTPGNGASESAPAINYLISSNITVSGGHQISAAPAINYRYRVGGVPGAKAVDVPAMAARLTMPPPVTHSIAVFLATPADGDVLPGRTPNLTVAITSQEVATTYTIDVQYADNAAFTGATTLSADVPVVEGGHVFTPATDVPSTTYWRARLRDTTAWTAAHQFTVMDTITPVTANVTWRVDTAAEAEIHLWHLDPAGPNIGDLVTIYGQGFPTSGRIGFGDIDITPQSWRLVPASGVTGSTRQINGDTVDPEHYEVTFIVPAVDGPGAALSVEA